MQRLAQLLGASVAFTLTWEHWRNSIVPLVGGVALTIVGPELDHVLGTNGILSVLGRLASFYLITIVFSIAWYRAIGTTGRVTMEYRFSRRTWHYIAGCLKLMALIFLFVGVAVTAAMVFADFEIPKLTEASQAIRLGYWLASLPIMYVMVRLGFIFPAAANDQPMTLGEALDASSSVQWPLFGTIIIIQFAAALAGEILAELYESLPDPLTYLVAVLGMALVFLTHGLIIAAEGTAYSQVKDAAARSNFPYRQIDGSQ